MNKVKQGLLLCLAALVLLCVACQKEEDRQYDMSGFTVNPGLVIVAHPTPDTTIMEVADQTTLQGFGNSVVANEGYRVAVLDAAGKEVTDQNTMIVNGMTFALYEDGKTEPKTTLALQVVDPVKVRRHYANVAQ